MLNPVLAKCRILIVDDDEANVQLLARLLRTAGYVHIKEITDARAAYPAYLQWAPDLVLLDLHMPHIDGIDLLHTFQKQAAPHEFVPVLVLTADVSAHTLKRALATGANDYVTKPFDANEVLLRAKNLLAIRLSHESLKNSNAELATALRALTQFEERRTEHRRDRINLLRAIIEAGPTMVFQPIIELATMRPVGVEALARFDADRPPDHWFAEATSLGIGAELEIAAIRVAVGQLDRLDADQFMAVNVSPSVMLDHSLEELLHSHGQGRVVLELTEHQAVDNYDDLGIVRERLRRDGVRIAIDDAGAGYASLSHILKLAPDIIKLDIALTRDVDRDPVKRALATSLLQFARDSNATVTAEGIETSTELETLHNLAVPWGQGFHIGRPGPLPELGRARPKVLLG